MPEYRRVKQNGGIYFFTLVTYRRQELFISPEIRNLLMQTVNEVREFHPFEMIAYCVLPDHVHFIWQMPENENDYSMRIGLIKRRFTKKYIQKFGETLEKSDSQFKRREVTIWQRRFWEHLIRDECDLEQHIEYVHYNPIKHGLVRRVCDWDFSSFHDFVKAGVYVYDWGESYKVDEKRDSFGE
jgi:putative transposase